MKSKSKNSNVSNDSADSLYSVNSANSSYKLKKLRSALLFPFAVVGFVGLYLADFMLILLVMLLFAGGIISVPLGLLRVIGKGDFIISDLAPITMFLAGVFLLSAAIALGIGLGKIFPASVSLLHRYSASQRKIWRGE